MRTSYRTAVFLTALAWAAFTASSAAAETYAQKLGWGPNDKVVIINSDDAGMSYAANQGIIESVEAGVTSSVTIMMPYPWVPGFVRYVREQNPDLCTGLHLQLCAEWDDYRAMPVAGQAVVPGLADDMGCLHDNNGLLAKHATAEEVEIELRAQIARGEKLGLDITHMDSHMWSVFSKPDFMEVYVKLAIEKQIPIRIVGDTVDGYANKSDRTLIEACAPFVDRVWEAGLPVLDDIHTESYSWDTIDKKALFIDAIMNVQPGVTEFVVHPTKPDAVIDNITGGRTKLYGDYYALSDPEVRQIMDQEGIILTTWRELRDRRAKLGN